MDVAIEKIIRDNGAPGWHYAEMTCGKKSCFVSVNAYAVTVCCKNAAHRAWSGSGRMFDNFAQAVAAYRSPEMRAMIETAREEFEPATEPTPEPATDPAPTFPRLATF